MLGALVGMGGLGIGGQGIDSVTIFGSNQIDVFPDEEDRRILTLFGSTEVVVRDDASARNSMTSIFGSSECQTACSVRADDPSSVTVSAFTMFGSVEFVTPGAAQRDR